MTPLEHAIATIPGSQHLESVICASLRWPSHHAGPLHGDPSRWDWGVTIRSLAEAIQRHERLAKFAASMTEAQRQLIWNDPSDEAAALRKRMTPAPVTRNVDGERMLRKCTVTVAQRQKGAK